MQFFKKKKLTVVTEWVIETKVIEAFQSAGINGYTILEARGQGDRGVREASWDASRNVQIEAICEEDVAKLMSQGLMKEFGKDYALVIFLSDVEVLRAEKF